MSKQENPYHIGDFTDYGYHPLHGPDGFKAMLTEPEDRNWYRDGAPVVDELNRLHARLRAAGERAAATSIRLGRELDDLRRERDAALERADDLNRLNHALMDERAAAIGTVGQATRDRIRRLEATITEVMQHAVVAEQERDAALERERALREALVRIADGKWTASGDLSGAGYEELAAVRMARAALADGKEAQR